MKKTKLQEALTLAVEAHAGQFDQAGFPYVLHPIRVSESLEKDDEKIVALLHDVVEDTDVGIDVIFGLFDDNIAAAVLAITKSKGAETYSIY
jgi:(p)ppGpp synthase/HD superfamily hydrolase